jgi:hypothetical protein
VPRAATVRGVPHLRSESRGMHLASGSCPAALARHGRPHHAVPCYVPFTLSHTACVQAPSGCLVITGSDLDESSTLTVRS